MTARCRAPPFLRREQGDDTMTTDLTGDFELGEDEFDWDVFLPDPDEVDPEAEAAALEDDAELSLDDSDFDWDGALRDDAGLPDSGADSDARSGAAYDRIVDTVRRSFEEDHLAEADADVPSESGAILAPIANGESETLPDAGREYAATGLAASFVDVEATEPDPYGVVGWAPADDARTR